MENNRLSAEPDPAGGIRSDRVLFVEGDFDAGFLRALLDRHERRRVQVVAVSGSGNLDRAAAARLAVASLDSLRWIGLALDADRDSAAALRRLRGAMERMNDRIFLARAAAPFPVPQDSWIRVTQANNRSATFFVFPGDDQPGDLEAWIWQALQGEPIATCVDDYIACLTRTIGALERESKTRIHTYLAALARPDMPLAAAVRAATLPLTGTVFSRLLDQIPRDDEEL